jgi:LysM repeat protein
MKILKIFGVVVGIHVFALILIFANPGCSSTSKPTPAPTDTVAKNESPPPAPITVPMTQPGQSSSGMTSAPIAFNPDAPAVAGSASSSAGGSRYVPTRPNTPAASNMVTTPVSDVTPATTYTVKSGDTLWDLGKKFKVPYADIAAANNLKSSAPLHQGQKLIIPSKPGSAATPASSTSTAPTGGNGTAAKPAANNSLGASVSTKETVKHVVKPGETLGSIARTYGVRQSEIAVANSISDPNKLKPGTELVIPGWQAAGGANGKSQSGAKAPATTEAKAPPSLIPTEAPKSSNDVPVIRVDDNPMTPAPK